MWIVRLALRRPYTFVVAALLLFLMGPVVILRTPTDILPNINIPVVSVIWLYGGLPGPQIEQRIVSVHERALSATVNDLEHIESQSLQGVGIIKLFFQPGASVDAAVAQVTAISQTIIRQMPPGVTPPLIIRYNASTVPILQLGLSSSTLSESELFDLGLNNMRIGLATVRGASVPFPYGGKTRQIVVDVDLRKLEANGLAPLDVVNAINAENLVLPSGTAKIGSTEYDVGMNGSAAAVDELNDLPVKTVAGGVIHLRDVANAHDGYQPQSNVVRKDGKRGVLLTVLKSGAASTLDIVKRVKAELPKVLATLPQSLEVQPFADQSLFVQAAVEGVVREAVIAAALTALMILLFLGNWQATFIIAISIPLSVLSSIIALSAMGETINLMTLGGLALAVGILVDDATVTIENVESHLARGGPIEEAILEGAGEIAMPTLVSTLCICIVFVPMFFLSGVARYLFTPLAMAVVFAMLASYVISRTLVPTLAYYFATRSRGHSGSLFPGFNRGFSRLRDAYSRALESCLRRRKTVVLLFAALCLVSTAILPFLGQDFFPSVDGGQLRLHFRGRSGIRIEETARMADEIEAVIRGLVPKEEMEGILDNIGVPFSGISLSYSNSGLIGSGDADILVSLKKGHKPTEDYVRELRMLLPAKFPGVTFYFLPADIVSQILNFGLPAPFDIQIVGNQVDANRETARKMMEALREIPGAVDLRLQQPFDLPHLNVDVDREKSASLGLTQRQVANGLLIALSGSSQVLPSYWLNPKNGINYVINVKVPEHEINSLESIMGVPISGPAQGSQLVGNLATLARSATTPVVTHYNVQRTIDIYGGVAGRDLGGVLRDVEKVMANFKKDLPRGSYMTLRGQAETMRSSFNGLAWGLLFAIVFVYMLLVVNFQSWLDPLIIISALPGSLAGVAWGLFATQTTLSVPALMGTIMSIGVATANSILVVSFARDALRESGNAQASVHQSAVNRLRPVLMTALAMIIGMIPMALGIGEGSEQNAPLGRAVIGGLSLATLATLFVVPAVFTIFHQNRNAAPESKP